MSALCPSHAVPQPTRFRLVMMRLLCDIREPWARVEEASVIRCIWRGFDLAIRCTTTTTTMVCAGACAGRYNGGACLLGILDTSQQQGTQLPTHLPSKMYKSSYCWPDGAGKRKAKCSIDMSIGSAYMQNISTRDTREKGRRTLLAVCRDALIYRSCASERIASWSYRPYTLCWFCVRVLVQALPRLRRSTARCVCESLLS